LLDLKGVISENSLCENDADHKFFTSGGNGIMSLSVSLQKSLRRTIGLALIMAMAPLTLSCYGRFPLTHAVYNMNGSAGGAGETHNQHKWIQSVLFWVLWIIPVYQVAIFADAVVLNLIEFWTGDSIDISSVQERDGVRVALESAAGGREAVLTVSRDGKLLTEQHMVKLSPTAFEMRDAAGNLTGKILKLPEGGIQLSDAQGQVIQTLAPTPRH
jgi:hypothetical protein